MIRNLRHRIGRSLQRTRHQIAAASVQWNAFHRHPLQQLCRRLNPYRFGLPRQVDCFDQLSIFFGQRTGTLG